MHNQSIQSLTKVTITIHSFFNPVFSFFYITLANNFDVYNLPHTRCRQSAGRFFLPSLFPPLSSLLFPPSSHAASSRNAPLATNNTQRRRTPRAHNSRFRTGTDGLLDCSYGNVAAVGHVFPADAWPFLHLPLSGWLNPCLRLRPGLASIPFFVSQIAIGEGNGFRTRGVWGVAFASSLGFQTASALFASFVPSMGTRVGMSYVHVADRASAEFHSDRRH